MYKRTCARYFYIPFYYGWCLFLLRMAIFFFNTDFTDWTDRTDLCLIWEQDKNQKNPLKRMEGVALMLCFRLGLIRASS